MSEQKEASTEVLVIEDSKSVESAGVNKSSNLSVAIIMIITFVGLLALVIWLKGAYSFKDNTGSNQAVRTLSTSSITAIYFIDANGILSAATRKFVSDSGNNDQLDARSQAKEFTKNYAALMNEYKSKGILILDSNAVAASPDGHDITVEVAEKMGLVMSK